MISTLSSLGWKIINTMIGFMYVSEATLCVHIGVYQPCPVLKRILDTNRID
jgi:hypothetical protein